MREQSVFPSETVMQCWPGTAFKEGENVKCVWPWELILSVQGKDFLFLRCQIFCLFFFWTQSRHTPSPFLPVPCPKQSNRLLETVFWMTESYLPSSSSQVVQNIFESGGLLAVGWSGNKNTIAALNGWPFCPTLSELFFISLTPTITPHRTPTPRLFAPPLKQTNKQTQIVVPYYGADFRRS